jgi:hypothetical protein
MPEQTLPDLPALKQHLYGEFQKAIELEFSTIPPYLTAMYTIKPGTNLPAYNVIRSVVMEEMLHLTLAANILNAIGGTPALNVVELLPEYPIELKFSDRQFPIDLQKFSPEAIETFLKIEMPAPRPAKHLLKAMGGFREIDLPGRSIGEFYDDLETALQAACEQYGETAVFSGDPARQVDTRYYYGGGGEALYITTLADALRAMHVIVDQGEASSDTLYDGDVSFGQQAEVAHYYRFNEIKLGRYYSPDDRPGDQPTGDVLAVDYTAVYDMKPNPKQADYPAGSELALYAGQFNQVYSDFMGQLHAAFNGRPEALVAAVTTMYQLKYKAIELIKNPIPGGNGQHAGPGFEYVAPPAEPATAVPALDQEPVFVSK